MNKLFYPAIGLYIILLLIFGLTTSSQGFFVLLLLLIIGLIINVAKLNEITKSRNTLTSKICFSFIFSLLIFFSILFFWGLGKNPSLDHFGFGLIIIAAVAGIGFFISFLLGIIVSVKRKNVLEYDYNIKAITLFCTVSLATLLILSVYNPAVSTLSQASKNENICYLSLAVSANSTLFNLSAKNDCFAQVARIKLDVTICKKMSGSQTSCYIGVAAASNDAGICKMGADEGLQGMDSCIAIVTEKKGIAAPTDMVMAVQICESTRNCDSIANMEKIIFNTLNDVNNPDLFYAISATKYMWKEGQRTSAIPLLRNLLTTASLENKNASMESLLYIIDTMDFAAGKEELRQILPLIENQSGLSNYTIQVKQRLSAQLLPQTNSDN